MTRPSVAVIGATGAVGRTIVRLLEERDFPLADLTLLATARSEGKRLPFRGEALTVRALGDRWHERVDLALSSAGATVARQLFADTDPVGQQVRVKNIPFTVLGVLSRKGGNLVGQDQRPKRFHYNCA